MERDHLFELNYSITLVNSDEQDLAKQHYQEFEAYAFPPPLPSAILSSGWLTSYSGSVGGACINNPFIW